MESRRAMEGHSVTRRAWLLAPLGLLLPSSARAAGFHITGNLDPSEQEAQEGYFPCGNDVAIVTRPKSPIHEDLLAMRGTEVQISVFNPK